MPIPTSETELTKLFSELGANDPELWARSEIHEHIPQMLRFLFLKNAWKSVAAANNNTWIDAEISDGSKNPTAPFAELGNVLNRCRMQGVTDDDLTNLARCLQAKMIFSICRLLEYGPSEKNPALRDVCWGLFQKDENGQPVGPEISGLHESVLAFDPTGHEMRPEYKK